MPTDWVEIVNAREFDNNAYPGITADIVAEFSSILVELHKLTFRDYFHRNLSFKQLFSHFELHLNKEISKIILRDNTSIHNRKLADLLYLVKCELSLL
ncbi:hypothetical protein [Spirosoma pollinicola]|uniref:hypothetical protein n=1 Tax=Spirosoma pollinicola TaxID=2057025 RepID=UPI0012FD0EE9|nr:hypothetical protein [Spirosoma pollinicola]